LAFASASLSSVMAVFAGAGLAACVGAEVALWPGAAALDHTAELHLFADRHARAHCIGTQV
jgi:hypothetical protein